MSVVRIQVMNFLFTVLNLCCKDKNKEKEAGNGTFFKKKHGYTGSGFGSVGGAVTSDTRCL